MVLGKLMDKFTASRQAKLSVSTRRNYIIINRLIEEVCGRDTSLDLIDDEFCDRVRSTLCRLPANYQKHPALKGRPIPEVIEIAAARSLPVIGPATINGHLTKLAAIIRFGREKGWITGNPMAGIDVHDPIDPSEKRHPLTTDHLNAIFATAPWSHSFAEDDLNPSRYWAPLIGLFSGARLTDICGLLVEEVIELGVLIGRSAGNFAMITRSNREDFVKRFPSTALTFALLARCGSQGNDAAASAAAAFAATTASGVCWPLMSKEELGQKACFFSASEVEKAMGFAVGARQAEAQPCEPWNVCLQL